jgi:hypothetical protein
LAKKRFFEQEKGYDPKTKRIEIEVEIPDYALSEENPDPTAPKYISFNEYCWKSEFKDSLSLNNIIFDDDDWPHEKNELPIDVDTIATQLQQYFEELFKVSASIAEKFEVLNKKLDTIDTAFRIVNNTDKEYLGTKDFLHNSTKNLIRSKYNNILEFGNALTVAEPASVKQLLDLEICKKICDLRIGKTTLNECFKPAVGNTISAPEYLLELLQPNPSIKPKGEFFIKAKASEFYNFLLSLNNHIPLDFITLGKIECFDIGTKTFKYSNFRKYKSITRVPAIPFPSLEAIFKK